MASNVANAAYYGNKGYKVAIVAILLIVMQVLMVTGRLVSRRLQKVMLGIDDYVLLPASVSLSQLEGRSWVDIRQGIFNWTLRTSGGMYAPLPTL